MKKINVVIYGATGSIGSSTLSIISKNLDKINIEGITCNKNILKLLKIAKSYNIKKIGFFSSGKGVEIYDHNKKKIKFKKKGFCHF